MSQKKFNLEIHKPYSTFTHDQPTPVPYLIDGLLPLSAFSVLGAKPKQGKSSMSRCEAVAVAKGEPFLDRPTTRGEVLLCSLEDPRQHVDGCLRVLEYNPETDAAIHLVTELPRDVTETVNAIADKLATLPHVTFVILDTLAKTLRARDSGSYDEMLALCEQLHDLARRTGVHIQALTHCKKVQPEDPFDGFLGSVIVRGEPDTNIVLFTSRGKRLIQSETRMGIPWEPTEIKAEVVTVGKSQMVKRFYFGDTAQQIQDENETQREANTRVMLRSRILAALKAQGGEGLMAEILDSVMGKKQMKYEARDELIEDGIVSMSGVAHSKNPLRLKLTRHDEPAPAVTPPVSVAREYLCCKYDDCTNLLPHEGFCKRHQELACLN